MDILPPRRSQTKIGLRRKTALNRKREMISLPCQRCGRPVLLHGNAILWSGFCLECRLQQRENDA